MKCKIEIKNRWSGRVQFTTEIEAAVNASAELKLGRAAIAAYESGAVLHGADLSGADLRGADLRGANLSGAVLSGANLSGAVLSGADLSDADLRDADLSGADLRGANLSYADLSGANLRGANLSYADLRGADLSGAVLSGANLSGAVLSGADLSDADLRDADLSGANLRGANLSYADLSGANLRGADLSEILEKEVPLVPNIDAQILASIEKNQAAGTNGLEMRSWHSKEDIDETNWCNTTHCRAGYAICMAGKAGFDLEKKYGPETAGMLLYMKSTPDAPIPDFYCGNEEAMADIRARAAKQTGGK